MVWAGTAGYATEPLWVSGIRGRQDKLGTSTTRGCGETGGSDGEETLRHADPDGARRLARESPVVTASDLIRDTAERRRLDQSIAEGGRGRRIKVASMAAASQSTPSQPESQESAHAPLLQWMEDWEAEGPEEGRKGRDWGREGVPVDPLQERLEGKESRATGQWCGRGRSRERLSLCRRTRPKNRQAGLWSRERDRYLRLYMNWRIL